MIFAIWLARFFFVLLTVLTRNCLAFAPARDTNFSGQLTAKRAILFVNTLGNVKKNSMEICIVMLGCKGLTSLGRSNYTIVITGFKALTTHLNLTLVFMVYWLVRLGVIPLLPLWNSDILSLLNVGIIRECPLFSNSKLNLWDEKVFTVDK